MLRVPPAPDPNLSTASLFFEKINFDEIKQKMCFILDGLFDLGVSGHAEVVVGAPDGDGLFAPGKLFGVREVGGLAQDALEDAVRVVLFLFGALLVEKVLVREEIFYFPKQLTLNF